MNLIGLYDKLSNPENETNIFNAIKIPEYPEFRIAKNYKGNAVLLLSVPNRLKDLRLNNFRLKYLQLEQNINCKISENEIDTLETFNVVTFKSVDRGLVEYFLKFAETLVKAIGVKPTQQIVVESLKKFVEVFKALSESPIKTVYGLWSELFLIDNSKNPQVLLNYWHRIPEEKFDFNAGLERVEVKSSSTLDRIHTFSSDQLNPPESAQVLIASIFVKQNNSGVSIQHLVNSICEKIGDDFELVNKLNCVVIKTLANKLEFSIGIKFDYEIAKKSLTFYKHQDIGKIDAKNIPPNVSLVSFRSDLTYIQHVDVNILKHKDVLFTAL